MFQVIKHKKPRKITQYWIRYTCGAVGLSVCSIWLLRHSRLVGSSDLDNWVEEARNSTYSFFKNHVEEPVHFFLIIYHGFTLFSFFFLLNIGEINLTYPYEIGVINIIQFS